MRLRLGRAALGMRRVVRMRREAFALRQRERLLPLRGPRRRLEQRLERARVRYSRRGADGARDAVEHRPVHRGKHGPLVRLERGDVAAFEGDARAERAFRFRVGTLDDVQQFPQVSVGHLHRRLGEHVIRQAHQNGEHRPFLVDALVCARALVSFALQRHHGLGLRDERVDAARRGDGGGDFFGFVGDVAHHAFQNLTRLFLRRLNRGDRHLRQLRFLVASEVVQRVRHERVDRDRRRRSQLIAQRADLDDGGDEFTTSSREFALNLRAHQRVHLVPHVPAPKVERLLDQVLAEKAHLAH
mmetsp:Transcript_6701/g.27153  ORF Transcript_6701/g.27153 Transcript_6701/m.27153 type:complete len:300 (-) Transcript_6701:1041-1940(-)